MLCHHWYEKQQKKNLLVEFYSYFLGIPIFLLCVANISGVLGEMFRFLYAKVLCRPCYIIKRRRAIARKAKLEEESGISSNRVNTNGWTIDDNINENSIKKTGNTFMNDSNRDDDEHQRNQRITVPLTITMLIIVAYIFIGAAIFHKFEGWTMIQAGYFCFITLGRGKLINEKKKKTIFFLFCFLATIGFGDFVSNIKYSCSCSLLR
jgi:hypothetical protein